VPHILVADDEVLQRKLIREALAGDPTYRFTEVSTGAEALEQIWADAPDVAILDVVMPDMGGLQVCRIMKGEPAFASIPVILITAYPSDERRAEAFETGAVHFVTKPFDIDEFVRLVSQLLEVNNGSSIQGDEAVP
jgi:CheY-like chemotaxis protein